MASLTPSVTRQSACPARMACDAAAYGKSSTTHSGGPPPSSSRCTAGHLLRHHVRRSCPALRYSSCRCARRGCRRHRDEQASALSRQSSRLAWRIMAATSPSAAQRGALAEGLDDRHEEATRHPFARHVADEEAEAVLVEPEEVVQVAAHLARRFQERVQLERVSPGTRRRGRGCPSGSAGPPPAPPPTVRGLALDRDLVLEGASLAFRPRPRSRPSITANRRSGPQRRGRRRRTGHRNRVIQGEKPNVTVHRCRQGPPGGTPKRRTGKIGTREDQQEHRRRQAAAASAHGLQPRWRDENPRQRCFQGPGRGSRRRAIGGRRGSPGDLLERQRSRRRTSTNLRENCRGGPPSPGSTSVADTKRAGIVEA